MPTTGRKGGRDLSLHLVDPEAPLYPGGVELGKVVRESHIVAPNATVRVRLQGRAKAKLVIDRGNNSKSYYRSRFAFWPRGAVAEVLHAGPVHVAQGPGAEAQSWPFTLALPTHTDAAGVNAALTDKERDACFLGQGRTSALGVPEQPLPATFFFQHSGFSKSWHGFVEYWLEAEMIVEGRRKMLEATLPVRVWSLPSPPPPMTDFGLVGRIMEGCVSTQRLMPGMEEAKLSFKQKSQKFFGSSKVPAFHYSLRVEYPTRVQLGNPSTIPFRLKLTPNKLRSSLVLEDVPQRAVVKSATLEVHSTTGVICPGTFDPHEASDSRKGYLGKTSKLVNEADGIVIPSSAKEEPLDLGAAMGLRLDATGSLPDASRFGTGGPLTLAPTYRTYCLQRYHMLKWEIQVLIAGESWECGWQQRIAVLPPVENGVNGDGGQAMTTLAVEGPVHKPPVLEEQVPAYDGPSSAAPSYHKVVGDNGEGSSTVDGDHKS